MPFKLQFTAEAKGHLHDLNDDERKAKKVRKALAFLETNPRHPSLQTHKYETLSRPDYDVFEAYVENRTPGAYRIFFRYGPGREEITIIAVTPHP